MCKSWRSALHCYYREGSVIATITGSLALKAGSRHLIELHGSSESKPKGCVRSINRCRVDRLDQTCFDWQYFGQACRDTDSRHANPCNQIVGAGRFTLPMVAKYFIFPPRRACQRISGISEILALASASFSIEVNSDNNTTAICAPV